MPFGGRRNGTGGKRKGAAGKRKGAGEETQDLWEKVHLQETQTHHRLKIRSASCLKVTDFSVSVRSTQSGSNFNQSSSNAQSKVNNMDIDTADNKSKFLKQRYMFRKCGT